MTFSRSGLFASAGVALAGALALAACSDDHDHDDGSHGHDSAYPACQAIVEACHEKDDGANLEVNGCHELAHDATSNATCEADQARCVALCTAAPVPGGDAGAGTDAAPATDAASGDGG